jgi:hypothetical protein
MSGLCDKDNNPIKCKCGNDSNAMITGNNSFIAWCDKCNPGLKGTGSFVYKPLSGVDPQIENITLGVKFAERRVILDDWWLIGGTRWSRTLFRLKHPFVYSKRGLILVWHRIKRIFVKERMIQPLAPHVYEDRRN